MSCASETPNPGLAGRRRSNDADAVFVRLAVERGLVTARQARQCQIVWSSAQAAGLKIRLSKIFVDRRLLTEAQVAEIKEAIFAGGVKPTIGPYEILLRLGSGGTSTVFKAKHLTTGEIIALKVLNPRNASDRENVARFLRGARIARKIRHPNVVAVLDVGRAGEYYFMALEYVSGQSLARALVSGKPLPERDALGLIKQVAGGLAAIHAAGAVHRDVKPSNVLITASRVAKIGDLDIARPLWKPDSGLTLTGQTLGTPLYMSPEQCLSADDVDSRSDVYSLGATLFHAVTGRPPYTGASFFGVMQQQAASQIPNPRECNPALSHLTHNLIWRMMAKKRSARPQTMQQVKDAIEYVERQLVDVAPPVEDVLQQLYQEMAAGDEERDDRQPVAAQVQVIEDHVSQVRAFAADWEKVSAFLAAGAPPESLPEDERRSVSDASRRIAENCNNVLPVLGTPGRGQTMVEVCRNALGNLPSPVNKHQQALLRQECKAGAKLLKELQMFLLQGRRRALSENPPGKSGAANGG